MWLYAYMFIPNRVWHRKKCVGSEMRTSCPASTFQFLLCLNLRVLTLKMTAMPCASSWCCKAYKRNCRHVLSRRHGEHSCVPSLPLGQTVRCPWNPIHRDLCVWCVIMCSANTAFLWVTLGCPTTQLAFLRPALERERVGVSEEWPSQVSISPLACK